MSDKSNGRSFVFYETYLNSIEELEDKELEWEVFKLICHYGIEGVIINDVSKTAKSIFRANQFNIDKSIERRKIAIENGLKGGAPIGNDNASKNKTTENNQNQPNINQSGEQNNLNANANDNLNANNNANAKETNTYKPTKEEVLSYAKNINCDEQIAIDFYKHYSSNNWKDNKSKPLPNWKSTLLWWKEKNNPIATDTLPTYDVSKNEEVSKEEENELLKLMGKEKISQTRLKDIAKEFDVSSQIIIELYNEYPSISEKQLIEEIQKQKENQYENQ